MELCKTYSHIKSTSSCKSKHKFSNKSRDQMNQRKRSVTFNSDVDLIKSISCQENLLDLIGKVQKQKQEYLLSLQNSQITLLPPLKIEQDENKTQKQQIKKQTNKEHYEFSIPMDPYKKQLYQKLNIYGKFIEPTQYKKIDYQQIQTFESAISQIQFQECNKDKMNKIQESDIQQSIDKLIQQDDDTQRFNQQYYSNYNQDYDLFQEQQKMNKIINEALKFKQQKREPINASKSVKQKRTQMRNYLENQYQSALNSVMQGININKDEDNLFLRKKYQKKIKLNNSFNNSRITSQYTKKAISSQIIHPERQEFINKTLEIYDKLQQSIIDSHLIQSTTFKTIQDCLKLGDPRTNLEIDENNDSTLSGKNTPEDEISKTQYTKIRLNNKPKLTFKFQTQNRITFMKQTVQKTQEDVGEQSSWFRRASFRQGSLIPQTQIQLVSNGPIDINNKRQACLDITQYQETNFVKDRTIYNKSAQNMYKKNQISQQYDEKVKYLDTLFNRYQNDLINIEQNFKYFKTN